MARSKTVHVIPTGKAWTVQAEGRSSSVYATKRAAMQHARHLAKSAEPGQMVVYTSDGRISHHAAYGFPEIKSPFRRSRIGSKRIERAVSNLVMDRLRSGLAHSGKVPQ
ncbi:MAG: DUF2188 domain-containing protein [Bryobacteraceae bacterium]|nr:DUF2188 domain-containing protein [Bryobacteraceae bacterium]